MFRTYAIRSWLVISRIISENDDFACAIVYMHVNFLRHQIVCICVYHTSERCFKRIRDFNDVIKMCINHIARDWHGSTRDLVTSLNVVYFSGYSGDWCESTRDFCSASNSVCQNGGTCTIRDDLSVGYSCSCADGTYYCSKIGKCALYNICVLFKKATILI